jgi:hypothetical protein
VTPVQANAAMIPKTTTNARPNHTRVVRVARVGRGGGQPLLLEVVKLSTQ